ncbi:MAG: hypothetical protein V9E83_10165 [Baekduia sp.]
MADWLPDTGVITALDDGELVVRREQDADGYRLTVAGHRASVEPVPEPGPDTIVLPTDPGEPPHRADGTPLAPFDEAPLLAALPAVPMASVVVVFSLDQSPYGARAIEYDFTDGQLVAMRLVDDVYTGLQPSLTAPPGADLVLRSTWAHWRRWRAGEIDGEQLLEGSAIQASWPYIALAQGLFEADAFIEARRALPAAGNELSLLRLVSS